MHGGRTWRYSTTIEINYEVRGDGPTTLVFLHGFAAALTTWDDLRDLFSPGAYMLYLLDLKGFGFSSKPRDRRYRLEDQAGIVVAFLRAHALSGVTLVGHSLGGGIALIAALEEADRDPDLIRRLVLIDAAAYPQRLPRFFRILRLPVLNRLLPRVVPVSVIVRKTLASVYHHPATITAARIDRYRSCFNRRGIVDVFIRTVQGLTPGAHAGYTARYHSLLLPTLIIWGEHDRVVRPSLGETLAADLPGSRLVVIPSCGHNPHEECPQQTFDAIRDFLDETSFPAGSGHGCK